MYNIYITNTKLADMIESETPTSIKIQGHWIPTETHNAGDLNVKILYSDISTYITKSVYEDAILKYIEVFGRLCDVFVQDTIDYEIHQSYQDSPAIPAYSDLKVYDGEIHYGTDSVLDFNMSVTTDRGYLGVGTGNMQSVLDTMRNLLSADYNATLVVDGMTVGDDPEFVISSPIPEAYDNMLHWKTPFYVTDMTITWEGTEEFEGRYISTSFKDFYPFHGDNGMEYLIDKIRAVRDEELTLLSIYDPNEVKFFPVMVNANVRMIKPFKANLTFRYTDDTYINMLDSNGVFNGANASYCRKFSSVLDKNSYSGSTVTVKNVYLIPYITYEIITKSDDVHHTYTWDPYRPVGPNGLNKTYDIIITL